MTQNDSASDEERCARCDGSGFDPGDEGNNDGACSRCGGCGMEPEVKLDP